MKKKTQMPEYIIELIKKHPNITSGRKNFLKHHHRIIKTLDLIKKYFIKN